MVGSHTIKGWSSTQAGLALSSGEAEYYGVVRAAGLGLGQQALYRDGGVSLPLRVWTDSSAAMGTAGRQGLGKMRHLDCHTLWLQQRLRRKDFELRKVLGDKNPADIFTKHLESASKLNHLVELFNCEFRDGRPEAAPQLKRDNQQKEGEHNSQSTARGGGPAEAHAEAVRAKERLPHLMPQRAMDEIHPAAIPWPAQYDDGDQDHDDMFRVTHDIGAGRRRVSAHTTGSATRVKHIPEVSRTAPPAVEQGQRGSVWARGAPAPHPRPNAARAPHSQMSV